MKGKGALRRLADVTMQQKIHQYHIVGRAVPTKKNPNPKIYRMRLFAKNKVLAKSKFWYFIKKLNKAKKSVGEILAVNEMFERKPNTVKNFGVWLRYDSRTGTHNMYKEFRDTSQNGAISQLYAEMSGRHRALPPCISILRVSEIKAGDCRREHLIQLHKSKLRFPAIRRLPMLPKERKKVFAATRPCLFKK